MSGIREQLEAKLVEAILRENETKGISMTLEEVLSKARKTLDDLEKKHGRKL